MGRRAKRCWGLVVAVALAPRPAAAEPERPAPEAEHAANVARPLAALIDVERGPGAEACPDAAAVLRSMARLFPEWEFRQSTDRESSDASARVVVRAVPAGYEAVLSVFSPHSGERVIVEKDPSCGGLADALALAFVMLVEPPDARAHASSNTEATPPGATSSTEPANGAATPPPTQPNQSGQSVPARTDTAPRATSFDEVESRHGGRSFRGNALASGVAGVGLLAEPAGGAALGVELFHRSGWGAAFEGVRLWSPSSEAKGGGVTLTVWALFAGACYKRPLNATSSVDACLSLGAGAQHAAVSGFESPRSRSVPWMVLAPTVGYRLGSPQVLSGFVRVGPVGQVRPQSFSVYSVDGSEGFQVARAPNFGVMAELGLSAGGLGF